MLNFNTSKMSIEGGTEPRETGISSSRNFSKVTVQHKLKTRLALQNNPTPLEFKQATLNAYQLIALCLCNKLTPILTEGPQKGC